MSKLTLTPDELEQLGCTAEEGAELEARDRRTQRAAKLARLAADLPKVRASAEHASARDGRTLNGVQYGRASEAAAATPSDPSDVAVLRHDDGKSLDLGGVVLPKGRVLSYLTREQFDSLEPASGFGEAGWERRLVFCQEPRADLRAMVAAGFADPIHDAFKGRERHAFESESDAAWFDRFVVEVIETTTDRDLLEGWLEAAGEQQHAIDIQARLTKLFGRDEPNRWGGKDDRTRFASPTGHVSVGLRG